MPLDHLYEMSHGDLVTRCVTLETALRALVEWSEGKGSDDFGEVYWSQARSVLKAYEINPDASRGEVA